MVIYMIMHDHIIYVIAKSMKYTLDLYNLRGYGIPKISVETRSKNSYLFKPYVICFVILMNTYISLSTEPKS